jgi:hypothetical protein
VHHSEGGGLINAKPDQQGSGRVSSKSVVGIAEERYSESAAGPQAKIMNAMKVIAAKCASCRPSSNVILIAPEANAEAAFEAYAVLMRQIVVNHDLAFDLSFQERISQVYCQFCDVFTRWAATSSTRKAVISQ